METSTIHQADGGGEEEWAESQHVYVYMCRYPEVMEVMEVPYETSPQTSGFFL